MSLFPYVPALACRLLHDGSLPSKFGRSVTVHASILLADLSGFTALVDDLASRYNDRAAEKLQEIVNRYFGAFNEVVDDAGGEVLVFPGDAALALWIDESGGSNLHDAVQRSARCGLELQRRLSELPAVDGIALRFRVAIGAGPGDATLVGAADGHSHVVFNGRPVEQLSAALRVAREGEVVLSPDASALAAQRVRGLTRGPHLVVTHAMAAPAAPAALKPVSGPGDSIVRAFVPPAVISRIEAGQQAWLAELRTVTVLYISLTGLDADHGGERLQSASDVIQTIAAALEGAINQVVADEKGVALIVAFGAIQRAHDDDPARGIRAALLIVNALRELELRPRIGVATGRVFTGARGGRTRLEFAMIGASVVLAARLADVSEAIASDSATRAACWRAMRFEPIGQVAVKGKAAPVDVWRPVSVKESDARFRAATIGRVTERRFIEDRLLSLEQHGQGSVMLVLGEPGIGKTSLINDLIRLMQGRAVRCLMGSGDGIERRTAYFAWRPIVASLLGHGVSDRYSVQERLTALLGSEAARLAPLLGAVLPYSIPENDSTSAFDAEARARLTRELIAGLLESAARTTPVLIVLEDVHWLDSASWALAEHAVAQVSRVALVLTARPPIDMVDNVSRMMSRQHAATLKLGALSHSEISELVCRHLDVDTIPVPLAELIGQRAEGHPLLAEELARVLRDRDAFVVRDGLCHINATLPQFASVLPSTVEGLVRTRIDQLTYQEQWTLKVAAVLGRQFTLADVAAVHPLGTHESALAGEIEGIVRSGLVQPLDGDPHTLRFSHAIVQEVTYELLPFDQRKELHRRTAVRIEQEESARLAELSPLLSYHWERAECWSRAIDCLERAGQRALRESSDREAEDCFRRLTEVADREEKTTEWVDVPLVGRLNGRNVRRAGWERLLAQAIILQGRQPEALDHLAHALTMLGQQVPVPRMVATTRLVRWFVAFLLKRPSRAAAVELSPTTRAALLETIRGYDALVQYRYLSDEGSRQDRRSDAILQSAYALVYATRTAERLGTTPELSRAYATLSTLLSFARAPRQASLYSARARQIAEQVHDRHALFHALTVGQLHAFVRGRWEEVEAALHEAMSIGEDLRLIHDCLLFGNTLALVYFHQGRLDDAASYLREIRTRAHTHHALPELWATAHLADISFRRGVIAEAKALAESALALADRHNIVDHNSRFQAHGVLAAVYLRQAQHDMASRHAKQACAEADRGASLSYSPQTGFSGVAEVLLARWSQGDCAAAVQLSTWLRRLRTVSWCRPILEPWSRILNARYEMARRRSRHALRQLRSAISIADQLQLRYESGLARAELAGLLHSEDPERVAAQQKAQAIFDRIGAGQLLFGSSPFLEMKEEARLARHH